MSIQSRQGVAALATRTMTMKNLPLLVDCRGMVCPMPIIQVRLALNQSKKDDLLVVYADDATFESEFARFCYLADIKLLEKTYKEGFQVYTIQVIK